MSGFRDRIAKLRALLGSDNAGERENAHRVLNALLRRHKKSWNDLPELLRPNSAPGDPPDDDIEPRAPPVTPTPVELVSHILKRHLKLKPHEFIAIAMWVVHTHVYTLFIVTPRLILTSHVRGCGKTTALSVIEFLANNAKKADSITAASIYHLVDQFHPTLLVDEGDNLGLGNNGPLHAVLNSGHRRGGSIMRYIGGHTQLFSTFTPMVLAAIGTLPLPIMARSIIIPMERGDGSEPLQRFDPNDTRTKIDMDTIYRVIFDWARTITLDPNPKMPSELLNRVADNWRPLLAIADACGCGDEAREAALEFNRTYQDEDAGVLLLSDTRDILDRRRVDRLPSSILVADLADLDDGLWAEW